jgi:hypothetical protein
MIDQKVIRRNSHSKVSAKFSTAMSEDQIISSLSELVRIDSAMYLESFTITTTSKATFNCLDRVCAHCEVIHNVRRNCDCTAKHKDW